MHDLSKLNSFETETLIRWFLYQMPMNQRFELMRALPEIYNKIASREIVQVFAERNGERIKV